MWWHRASLSKRTIMYVLYLLSEHSHTTIRILRCSRCLPYSQRSTRRGIVCCRRVIGSSHLSRDIIANALSCCNRFTWCSTNHLLAVAVSASRGLRRRRIHCRCWAYSEPVKSAVGNLSWFFTQIELRESHQSRLAFHRYMHVYTKCTLVYWRYLNYSSQRHEDTQSNGREKCLAQESENILFVLQVFRQTVPLTRMVRIVLPPTRCLPVLV